LAKKKGKVEIGYLALKIDYGLKTTGFLHNENDAVF